MDKVKLILWLSLGIAVTACTDQQASSKKSITRADSLFKNSENDSVLLLYNPKESEAKALRVDSFFQEMHKKRGFNGVVLVGWYGHVLYEKTFGYADFGKKDTLTLNTAFQLASVSKQFTAMAVMLLKHRGKLKYDDNVKKFFPNFPYEGITVRQLLTHRSGLPNYTYFSDKHWDRKVTITNADVLNLMIEYKPEPYYSPDTRFDYSNTGYCLLASIVEKVSGVAFEDFVQKEIFKPLGMNHSMVYNRAKKHPIPNAATGYLSRNRKAEDSYLNGVVGDKGVYSTALDLYRWDQSLYTEKLVKKSDLEEAFSPGNKDLLGKDYNYGFGWRIHTPKEGDPYVFHGGWWHGFNSYLMRNRKDHSTIIILSNLVNGTLTHVKELKEILHPSKNPLALSKKEAEEGGE